MAIPDPLAEILNRVEAGHHTASDLLRLKQALQERGAQEVWQLGKYAINIGDRGQNIQIGDRTYYTWNEAAIKALVQAIREPGSNEDKPKTVALRGECQNKPALKQYLDTTFEKLKSQGCLEIWEDVRQGSQTFDYAARIQDFEMSIGPIGTRGEAFFVLSEFSTVSLTTLRQFSGQCHQWAKTRTEKGTVGQAIYNFRMPTHVCFAIAIADQIDESTKQAIQTINPLDHKLDALWYEVPVVRELDSAQTYFYNRSSSFLEQFKGEVAWKPLRKIIQEILSS